MTQWNHLTQAEQVLAIKNASMEVPQLIFKHSTTCSISGMAKNRLDRAEAPTQVVFHYLDLLSYRPVSALVAETFNVHHESPQVLLIHQGACIYDESHYGITMDEIAEQVDQLVG
jgi:bacillithiol system protein YtxJ